MKTFLERLGKERLYFDGGTGSLLQARGLKGGELPERWNITHPDVIADVARSYFEAGSDVVNTNTFGANRLHFPDPDELEKIVTSAVALAKEGRRLAGRLASIKVVFSEEYEDVNYTDSDVEQLYSEIEKDVNETIRDE
jgi:5-methyltetrahydrofolate--homocysteine methyltransferase